MHPARGILDPRAGGGRVPGLAADPVADPRADLDAGGGEDEDDPRARESAEET